MIFIFLLVIFTFSNYLKIDNITKNANIAESIKIDNSSASFQILKVFGGQTITVYLDSGNLRLFFSIEPTKGISVKSLYIDDEPVVRFNDTAMATSAKFATRQTKYHWRNGASIF